MSTIAGDIMLRLLYAHTAYTHDVTASATQTLQYATVGGAFLERRRRDSKDMLKMQK